MMKHYSVDFRDIYTRESLHTLLQESLDLPDYYGRNLDALMDCLSDFREDCEIEFRDLSSLINNLMGYGKSLLDALHIAAFENHHLTLIFREDDWQRQGSDD